jgi:hypothetical protein
VLNSAALLLFVRIGVCGHALAHCNVEAAVMQLCCCTDTWRVRVLCARGCILESSCSSMGAASLQVMISALYAFAGGVWIPAWCSAVGVFTERLMTIYT